MPTCPALPVGRQGRYVRRLPLLPPGCFTNRVSYHCCCCRRRSRLPCFCCSAAATALFRLQPGLLALSLPPPFSPSSSPFFQLFTRSKENASILCHILGIHFVSSYCFFFSSFRRFFVLRAALRSHASRATTSLTLHGDTLGPPIIQPVLTDQFISLLFLPTLILIPYTFSFPL